MKMGINVPWSESYCNNCFETPMFFKNPETNLLGNWQEINPMDLGATLAHYKNKQLFTNTKILPTTLRWNKIKFRGLIQGRLLF